VRLLAQLHRRENIFEVVADVVFRCEEGY